MHHIVKSNSQYFWECSRNGGPSQPRFLTLSFEERVRLSGCLYFSLVPIPSVYPVLCYTSPGLSYSNILFTACHRISVFLNCVDLCFYCFLAYYLLHFFFQLLYCCLVGAKLDVCYGNRHFNLVVVLSDSQCMQYLLCSLDVFIIDYSKHTLTQIIDVGEN